MWEYICPKCRKSVKQSAHECPYCGEKFPLTIRIPPSFLKDPKKLEEYVHKHIFPRISEFERNYLTKYFTILFVSDWELSGGVDVTDAGRWSNSTTTGTLDVVAAPVHHGSWALRAFCADANDWSTNSNVENVFGPYPEFYLRVYVRFTSLPSNKKGYFMGIDGAAYLAWLGIDDTAGVKSLTCAYYDGWGRDIEVAYAFVINTWYCVELRAFEETGSSDNGIIQAWINGTLQLNLAGLDNEAEGNVVKIWCGAIPGWGSWGGGTGIIIDCVVGADARINCEGVPKPKGTIAIAAKLAEII
jgi:hypothetical protein